MKASSSPWSRRSLPRLALRRCARRPAAKRAAIIGQIAEQPAATVLGTNGYGGTRVIDMLVGDPLPRIC